MTSLEEGAPDFATLDNEEMLQGVEGEYNEHSTTTLRIAMAAVRSSWQGTARAVVGCFGPDGRHNDDYPFYYDNIKDNVAKHVAAYIKG